ncbi:hypothetical protein SDC9_41340 [bioreactor metagenome]|uniref:HD domain-containing protein n=1 Tax=bioreactor metagenome TaxID=1076179 RepID=A0A644VXX8_9ZZZZ
MHHEGMSDMTFPRLLDTDIWGEFTSLLSDFRTWQFHKSFIEALSGLRDDVLYQSEIHGRDHIQRVLLLSALLAWKEEISADNIRLLYYAASYHDIGRINDTYDTEHGTRSAARIHEITGLSGEELKMVQGAVAAHSRPDSKLESTVEEYRPFDFERGVELAKFLKDADGLDRVRISDLNPTYLRHKSAVFLAPFAKILVDESRQYGLAAPPINIFISHNPADSGSL